MLALGFLLFCDRSRRARAIPWLFHSYAGHTAAAASSLSLSTIVCGATGQPSQWIAQLNGPPRPVLDRLRQVRRLDPFTLRQVRNRARQFQDAVEGPRAHL